MIFDATAPRSGPPRVDADVRLSSRPFGGAVIGASFVSAASVVVAGASVVVEAEGGGDAAEWEPSAERVSVVGFPAAATRRAVGFGFAFRTLGGIELSVLVVVVVEGL